MPPSPLLPADASFLPGVPSSVPAWRTPSGHLLVRPSINGRSPSGYFLLDTGASGFVVEPGAADAAGMAAFGEVHVIGMAGKVASRFRRAESFQLGPLLVRRPAMMEMRCSGLVRGAPGPVVGIVGADVFRRAVVDIPPQGPWGAPQAAPSPAEADEILGPAAALAFSMSASGSAAQSAAAGECAIALHSPEGGAADALVPAAAWLPVVTLSGLPFLRVCLEAEVGRGQGGQGRGRRHSTLLMLDTGAGGMGVMANAACAEALGLLGGSGGGATTKILGVGGDPSQGMALRSTTLSRVEVAGGGGAFAGVRCLFAPAAGAGGGIELSHYAGGILCGEPLGRGRLVMDLARGRAALVHEVEGG
jgi:hypothetical protein